ncbi:MAG: hypothetical protein U0T82_17230 [Bacteroidales bacterium]
MAFAHKLRLSLGESKLRKKSKDVRRDKRACNLREARTAGILFDASDPSGFEPVKSLVSQLTDRGIQVQIIGFVNDKKVPDAYLLRRSFNFISRNELSWIYRPTPDFADEFIQTSFDILFNLDLKNSFPTRYITTLSRAKFKTGLYQEQNEFLDFMISLKPNPSLENLIFQLLSYLGELKTQPPALVTA